MCARTSSRNSKRRRRADPAALLYELAKRRAKAKGLPFTITVDDVRAVYPADGKCPVLGLTLSPGERGPHDASPTLDRLNNSWGYEPHNICVISHRANAAKRAMRATELEAIAAWMRSKGLD